MSDNGQPSDGWLINADIKMKEFREFMKVSEAVNKGQDTSEMYPSLAKFVKAWPHSPALDPAIPDSYDELTITQFREVVQRVTGAFQVFAGAAK